jgi:TonB family protein
MLQRAGMVCAGSLQSSANVGEILPVAAQSKVRGMEASMKRILLAASVVLLILSVVPLCAAQNKAALLDTAVAITSDIAPPRLTEVASPFYTEEAKKKKIEGSVTLLIVIDTKGDVIDAKVVKGLGHGLDENAIIAEKDGEPVTVKMEVSVGFNLPV